MFKLIQQVPDIQRNSYNYPDHKYVTNILRGNVERMEAYMSKKTIYLDNSNLLVDLIQSLPLNTDTPDSEYFSHILYSLDNFLYSSKISSDHKEPVFVTECIYSKIPELYISKPTELLNISDRVLKIEYHPFDTLALPVLGEVEAIVNKAFTPYAVFSINVPLLAVKYRRYRNEIKQRDGDNAPVSTSDFITQVLLPDLYIDHANLAMANILFKQLLSDPSHTVKKTDGITLTPVTPKANDSYAEIVGDLIGREMTLRNMLRTVPLCDDYMLEDIVTNLNTKLDQGHYLEMLCNFKILEFLLTINNVTGSYLEQNELMTLKKELKYLKNNNGLKNSFTDDLLRQLLRDQTDILISLL